LRRPQRAYPAATVVDFLTAVLTELTRDAETYWALNFSMIDCLFNLSPVLTDTYEIQACLSTSPAFAQIPPLASG
jgi:hypothetical protein